MAGSVVGHCQDVTLARYTETLAAIPFGQPTMEKLSLNHDSLWSGGPFENDVSLTAAPSHRVSQYAQSYMLVVISCVQESSHKHAFCFQIMVLYLDVAILLRIEPILVLDSDLLLRNILVVIRPRKRHPIFRKYASRYSRRAPAVSVLIT